MTPQELSDALEEILQINSRQVKNQVLDAVLDAITGRHKLDS